MYTRCAHTGPLFAIYMTMKFLIMVHVINIQTNPHESNVFCDLTGCSLVKYIYLYNIFNTAFIGLYMIYIFLTLQFNILILAHVVYCFTIHAFAT